MSRAARRQRADALRAADLVGRERQGVGAERAAVDGDLAGRLDGVDVQPAVGRAHELGGLGDRLDDAGLVVGQHQGDKRPRRRAPALARASREIGHAVGVDRQLLDRRARKPAVSRARVVLDRRR